MKKIAIWAMVLTAIMLGACTSSDDVTESQQGLGSIYGIVTELGTAEPMKAVGVELYQSSSLLLKTVTFDDGHFEFKDLNSGSYQLRVVAEGYEQTEKGAVTVEAGRQARMDLQVKKVEIGLVMKTIDATVNGASVTLNGELKFSDASYPNEIGFLYGTNNNLKNGGTVVKCKDEDIIFGYNSIRTFSASVNNLGKGTYYFQAYAINSKGSAYGEVRSFNINLIPAVTTLAPTNVLQNTATLNGRIDAEGDPVYTERGFVYSQSFNHPTVDDPIDATKKLPVQGRSIDFSANISSLTENARYYVRAYAMYEGGTVYGDIQTFRTGNPEYMIIDNLMVQRKDLGRTNWTSARDMCENSLVGGFSDWRLPTLSELSKFYTYKEDIGGFVEDYYWTSTVHSNYSYYHKIFNFSTGNQDFGYSPDLYYVRAVRTVK